MQQPSASVVGESPSVPFDRTMDSVDLSLFLINSAVPREVCDVFESKFSVYWKRAIKFSSPIFTFAS